MWVYFSRDFLKAKQTEYSQARSSWVHASEASPPSERAEQVTQIEQTKQNQADQPIFANQANH